MAAAKKNSSVVTVRAKETIALPPMTLGFSSLVKPDEYDPEKPTFKLNGHLTPEGIEAMKETIAEKVYTEKNVEKLREECAENGIKKMADPQDPEAWLEAKLKEPKENARLQLPHLVISNRAFFNRNGERVQRTIGCWDANNRKLNLAKLRLGAGSVIQAIVYPNLFFSKIIGVPQPSLKLVGVRVLKLEQWGGQRAPEQADDEEIAAVMGEGFEYDDLAAYADTGRSDEPDDDDDHDEDEGDPTPPADKAKGMF